MVKDDLAAALGHSILAVVAANSMAICLSFDGGSIKKKKGDGDVLMGLKHPLVHMNFLVHGAVGFINYLPSLFGFDMPKLFAITMASCKYLSLPILCAQISYPAYPIMVGHMLSGMFPMLLELVGCRNDNFGRIVVMGNMALLATYSIKNKWDWGWATVFASTLLLLPNCVPKVTYPLSSALVEGSAFMLLRDLLHGATKKRNFTG